jgi:hypothetical protein
MIGTRGAAVLLLVNIIFAGVLGLGAGGLMCLVLRRPWRVKVALIDAVLGAVAAVIAAYVVSSIDNARGVLDSRVGLVLVIAACSVVLRHLLSPGLRFAR